MNVRKNIVILSLSLSLSVLFGVGCSGEKEPVDYLDKPVPLGKMVDSFGRFYQSEAVSVRGFGIVAGLGGTGSSECPPILRDDLVKFIRKEVRGGTDFNPNSFINSLDTAVVEVFGVIPSLSSKGDNFDVYVRALADTQTTSLSGGRLYTAELKESSRFVRVGPFIKTVASAQGPIFVDKVSGGEANELEGFVLGGGVTGNSVRISLVLNEANYFLASAIRNQVNERFGPGVASAISPSEVQINIPEEYRFEKGHFLSMVRVTFLADSSYTEEDRISALLNELVVEENMYRAEVSLEAIGRHALNGLAGLLGSEDESVRFHAANCMVRIGDARGLEELRRVVFSEESPNKLTAVRTIGVGATRRDSVPILNKLLAGDDMEVRFAAYGQLRRLEDISVSRILVGGDFFVETVLGGGPKVVYVSRKDGPRVVLFGGVIRCEDNIFVETSDHNVMVNARAGDKFVSMLRKHRTLARPIGPLKCSYNVSDVVRTLCERLDVSDTPQVRQGLGASYSDAAGLLKIMCETGAIKAEFIAGDAAEIPEGVPGRR